MLILTENYKKIIGVAKPPKISGQTGTKNLSEKRFSIKGNFGA